ncbi:sulfite exporter TauE/SafE family protein [Kaarinaea lacus]
MNDPLSLTSAFLIGLLGSAHCVGMCGGIMNALSMALPAEKQGIRQAIPILLLYNLGRIFSYCLAGAFLGAIGFWLLSTGKQAGPALRLFAGMMMIAMGLYLSGWWRGLVYLEKLGGYLWKYLQPAGNRLMPVSKPWQALLLGIVWGWLPCGLVYSTLTLSVSAADWRYSTLIMLSFGLGTLPAMLLTGTFSHQVKNWMQRRSVRNIAALLIIGFGVWTIAWVVYHRLQTQHPPHHNTPASETISNPIKAT